MSLQEYLKSRGESVADFAQRISEAENTIRKIVYRQRQPSLPLAVKISSATNEEVTVADMVVEVA